jgi:hypothetical protein
MCLGLDLRTWPIQLRVTSSYDFTLKIREGLGVTAGSPAPVEPPEMAMLRLRISGYEFRRIAMLGPTLGHDHDL